MYNEDTIEPAQRGHRKLLHKGKSASGGPGTGNGSLLEERVDVDKSNPKDSVVEENNYSQIW